MDGVTILNEFEVAIKVFSWEAVWWGAFIGVVLGIWACCITGLLSGLEITKENWAKCFGALCVTCVFMGLLGGMIGASTLGPDVSETRYEVSIGENVNMQEFRDKYEIIETRGYIYTVREKCE